MPTETKTTQPTERHCLNCGEPEGSPYARRCCWDSDNMTETYPSED